MWHLKRASTSILYTFDRPERFSVSFNVFANAIVSDFERKCLNSSDLRLTYCLVLFSKFTWRNDVS